MSEVHPFPGQTSESVRDAAHRRQPVSTAAVERVGQRVALVLALLAAAWLVACSERGKGAAAPPNFLVIVADDLGMNDVGAFGGELARTPAIDALAQSGTRFTRFYTAGQVCDPTRASLLTGLYPQRIGYRRSPRGLPDEVKTLPEQLREAGYATHHVGKWHLGVEPERVRPLGQGFDTFYGFLHAKLLEAPRLSGYWNPKLMRDEGERVRVPGHLTDLLSDEAVTLIRSAPRDRPWLINLWYFAPHEPIQPLERFATGETQDRNGRYRALVSTLDAGIGRVLAALEETGQDRNTVVLFLSDNGAVEAASNRPYLGVKTQLFEGSLRVPFVLRIPGRSTPSQVDAVVSSLDLHPTLVALAGLELTEPVDGVDLAPLLEGRALAPRRLFWEGTTFRIPSALGIRPDPDREELITTAHAMDFSVLSADGRWRYVRDYRSAALFDLASDPSGHRNVLDAQRDLAESLLLAFREWELQTERIPVRASAVGAARWEGNVARLDGHGWVELAGHDVTRTPGVGTWALEVGLRRDAATSEARVIAAQAGAFSLVVEADGTIVFELGGARLEAPGPQVGECAGVIVTAFHRWTQRKIPNAAVLQLYVSSRLIPFQLLARAEVDAAALDAPTTLGGAPGRPGFIGELFAPSLLNAPLEWGEAVRRSQQLCTPPATVGPAARSSRQHGPSRVLSAAAG